VGKSSNNPLVGFDLGGTKMLAIVVDGSFKEIGRERKKTKSPDGTVDLERIMKTIRSALEQAGVGKIGGIGLGVPGVLDLDSGTVIDAPNLGWHDVALQKKLENEFNCPVRIINDVDAGVYGEYRMGAAKDARCTVGIFPGTGIGAGCVYKGELLRGKSGSCMEIGHIPIVPDGILCGCGRTGCLETVASRLAISSAAASAVFRGEAPHLTSLAGTDISNIKSGVLADAIAAGDKVIEKIVRKAAQYLGKATATVIDLIAPDLIVLGGGLVEAMPSLYKDEVEKTAKASVMPAFEKIFHIETAKLGDDATALGAAAWVDHEMES